MSKEKDPKLMESAKYFISITHVLGLVHAKEGGVINLDEYLVDFYEWMKKGETK